MLQIRRDNTYNLGIIFSYVTVETCCNPSLEWSHLGGSNEGLQRLFLLRNEKIVKKIHLSGALDGYHMIRDLETCAYYEYSNQPAYLRKLISSLFNM